MMDFTVKIYKKLISALQADNYTFLTYKDYFKKDIENYKKIIILRHDVDNRPVNSLHFARLQTEAGIKGTYYFRIVPQSFDISIIREIVNLGHEVGYHYETMEACKGDVDKAYDEFCKNLEKFRMLADVKTISMHGSPLSPYDNREIWKKYDYRKLGIMAEPYFDINFNELFYLTDTGRRWDGHKYNVRDKTTHDNPLTNPEFLNLKFHSTSDIIKSIESDIFPVHCMLNFHPQRWHDELLPWVQELLMQNLKNQAKRLLILLRK